jgi:hypothetical protein
MMTWVRRAALFGVLFLGAGGGRAHAQESVSGTWQVRWAQAIRVEEDESVTIQRWGEAELALVQDGDEVTGTWTTNVLEEVTWSVRGTFRDGRLRLEATEHDSDNPELAMVERLVWDARVVSDGLEGEMWMELARRRRQPARRPFTAERAR